MIAVLLLLACGQAGALLDVPLGECYDCEVTCFEDCALKYDREVIKADDEEALRIKRKARLDKASVAARGALISVSEEASPSNRTQTFSWRSPKPEVEAQKNELIERGNAYAQCLKAEKCPGHPAKSNYVAHPRHTAECAGKMVGTSLLAKKKCSVSDMPCPRKCAAKVAESFPALLQDVPLHPVKIGTFSKGHMNLDFCLKSCLAATCGCDNAPGFDTINKLANQIKTNEALREPVSDTEPSWQYRKATLSECAGGIFGQKITSNLWVNFGRGWLEVCTEPMLVSTLGVDADVTPASNRCKSTKRDDADYGCRWSNDKEECIVGFSEHAKCFVKFQDDTLNSKFADNRGF